MRQTRPDGRPGWRRASRAFLALAASGFLGAAIVQATPCSGFECLDKLAPFSIALLVMGVGAVGALVCFVVSRNPRHQQQP